jgi:hypothetical protein
MKKERTHKQILADILRKKIYKGCHGQNSAHGAGRYSIQIFCADTPENRIRFSGAESITRGSLTVLDFDI